MWNEERMPKKLREDVIINNQNTPKIVGIYQSFKFTKGNSTDGSSLLLLMILLGSLEVAIGRKSAD